MSSDAPRTQHRRWSRRAETAGSSAIRDLLSVVDSGEVLSLAGGLPAVGVLPAPEVAAAVARVLGSSGTALQYGPTEGEPSLRSWVAENELGDVDPSRVLVVGSSRVDLQACKLEYSIVSPK